MSIKEIYKEVKGNYDGALAIMMNDSFIERMLSKFFSNNSYDDIISFYEKKDFQSLFAAVHSFKGVVGNLSLTPLYELASTITEKTRKQEVVNIDSDIEELKNTYNFTKECFEKISK